MLQVGIGINVYDERKSVPLFPISLPDKTFLNLIVVRFNAETYHSHKTKGRNNL